MPNVISSFLVGVGFDYDKKGADEIGSGIDGIKSKALQLGAVVAGAFGIKALTVDFAQGRDELGKFADVFGGTATDIQAIGTALATEGGSLESFMGQLENLERLRAGLLVGDAGFIAQAGKAGIDTTGLIEATTSIEAFLDLADQFAGMTRQERLNAASALGLDRASILLLSKGREEVETIVSKFRDIRPVTDEMTESAAEFNRQWIELNENAQGFADILSAKILPIVNDVGENINNWFGDERSGIRKFISNVADLLLISQDPAALSEKTGIPEFLLLSPDKQLDRFIDRGEELGTPLGGATFDAVQAIKEFFSTSDGPVGGIQFDRPAAVPPMSQSQPTQQNINLTLQLDGQVLDKRTVRVVDGMAQTAIDDLTSSTGG